MIAESAFYLALLAVVSFLVLWMWHELVLWIFSPSVRIWPLKSQFAGNIFLFFVLLALIFLALSSLWALGGCEGNFKAFGCAHISDGLGSIPAIGLVLVPMVIAAMAPVAILVGAIAEWRARKG